MQTPAGTIPRVCSTLGLRDFAGMVRVRCGIFRMSYAVDPGLYALGNPDADSPVLVSANYKMSFDLLRRALPGRNAWVLVLDTNAINVWCAAGKGTFGTGELAGRIESSGLAGVVAYRRLIVPQLAASGVSAHKIKELTGFRVAFGPVEASDLPAFLDSGCKAAPEMRVKTFTLAERLVLVPIEIVSSFKLLAIIIAAVFLLSGFGGGAGGFLQRAWVHGATAAAALILAVLCGAAAVPALLPWLPGRAFAAKGFFAGGIAALLFVLFRAFSGGEHAGLFETVAWLALIPAIASYLGMNFTGCSTFTSLSGVKKEMRLAVPLQIAGFVAGTFFWLISRFFS